MMSEDIAQVDRSLDTSAEGLIQSDTELRGDAGFYSAFTASQDVRRRTESGQS